MADHAQEQHGQNAPAEHAHPGAKEYVGIAVILLLITVVEVWVFYVPSMKHVLAPTLLTLSAVKFSIVAMWYMHLKFDHKLFSWLFVVPMAIAALVVLALIRLFAR